MENADSIMNSQIFLIKEGPLDWLDHPCLFKSRTSSLEVHCIKLPFMLFQLNSNFPLRACFCPPSNLLMYSSSLCGCPSSRVALLHRVQMPWLVTQFLCGPLSLCNIPGQKAKNSFIFSLNQHWACWLAHSLSLSLCFCSLYHLFSLMDSNTWDLSSEVDT